MEPSGDLGISVDPIHSAKLVSKWLKEKAYVKPDSQVLSLKDVIIDQTVVMFPILMAMGTKMSLPTVNGYVNGLRSLLYDPLSDTHAPSMHFLSPKADTWSYGCVNISKEERFSRIRPKGHKDTGRLASPFLYQPFPTSIHVSQSHARS